MFLCVRSVAKCTARHTRNISLTQSVCLILYTNNIYLFFCQYKHTMHVQQGVYIANFHDRDPNKRRDLDNWETNKTGKKVRKLATDKKTVISFDRGAIWNYLAIPEKDAFGRPIKSCGKGCHLHLHGYSDAYGPFYSVHSAIGIILATGVFVCVGVSDDCGSVVGGFHCFCGLCLLNV